MHTHLCLTRYLTEQQEEHRCQDCKREFQNKKRLSIQLLLPTFLLGNQCKLMHSPMHTFQQGRSYSQQRHLYRLLSLCLHSLVHRLCNQKQMYYRLLIQLLRFHLGKRYKTSR